MQIMIMPRRMGKTYQLCFKSDRNNIPIIVSTEDIKNELLNTYKQKFTNLVVYTVNEFMSIEHKPEEVLIDDIGFVLNKLLGTHVLIGTHTPQ